MLELCNYRRIGNDHGALLTETKFYRLLYLTEETLVELDCPDGKLREK